MKRSHLLVCILLSVSNYLLAQDRALAVGDTVPGNVMKSLITKKTTKLVIIDFWTTHCGTCMSMFPHMENLQKEFPEQLQVVLVNSRQNTEEINKNLAYVNKIKQAWGENVFHLPDVTAINGDTILAKLFPYLPIPHHVWINDRGKVLAITQGYNATPEHVKAILEGKHVDMILKDDFRDAKLEDSGFLKSRIADLPIYYSSFIPSFSATSRAAQYSDTIRQVSRQGMYNFDVIAILQWAFVNENPEAIVREMQNKEQYELPPFEKMTDDWVHKYYFCYEIQMPLKDADKSGKIKQDDVNNYFGNLFGLHAGMENRKFTIYTLTKTKKIVKAKKAAASFNVIDNTIKAVNTPLRNIATVLDEKLQDPDHQRILYSKLNGEDLNTNVTLTLNADLNDIPGFRKQLNAYGLDIVSEEKELRALVIKDK